MKRLYAPHSGTARAALPSGSSPKGARGTSHAARHLAPCTGTALYTSSASPIPLPPNPVAEYLELDLRAAGARHRTLPATFALSHPTRT